MDCFVKSPQVDYLILGNHFQWADPEHPRAYTAAPMLLEEYLTTTLAGCARGSMRIWRPGSDLHLAAGI